MRTTVTLEPEVAALLRRVMRERGMSFKEALNSAVKASLTHAKPKVRFKQRTFSLGREQCFRWDKALKAAAALEDEELVRKISSRK